MPNNQTKTDQTAVSFLNIIADHDADLMEFAKEYFGKLHRQLGKLSCPLYFYDDVLIRFLPYEFTNLNPLQKHLEILRAEAEAMLINQRLITSHELPKYNYWTTISSLKARALGIPPTYFEEQFAEILSCSYFKLPDFYSDVNRFKSGLEMIEKEFGQATALALGMLVLCGVKTPSKICHYGGQLDCYLSKVTNLPQIAHLIEQRAINNSFENQFVLVATLREMILQYLPKRKYDNKKLQLVDVLDTNLNPNTKTISGDDLVFATLDGVVLSKIGFEVNFVISDSRLCLEIVTPEKLLYWWPLSSSAVSMVLPTIEYRGNFLFLIAWYLLNFGEIYFRLTQDFHKELDFYLKAKSLAPDLFRVYIKLAQACLKMNNPNRAIEYLKSGNSYLPSGFGEYYELLGLAYCLLRDWESGIDALRQLVTLQPNNVEGWNNLACAYFEKGDLKNAEKAYQTVLNLNPNYFSALFGLGNLYFALRQFEKAVSFYKMALKIKVDAENVLFNLGQAFYEMGAIAESIRTYKKLLRVNPKHATAWNNLGIIYRNQGMKRQAMRCLEQAVKLNPNLIK
ncbi:MAG: tetratricopeptide repeat protein [candidate division WOR-3 bacterium]|nr:tetratricopeptide repeat protein [candidate division WOR-3 bacterium]